MNLENIIEEINKDADDTLDNAEIIGWVNRCLDDLSPYSNYQKSTVISVVSGQKEYELPSDVISIFQLVDRNRVLPQLPVSNYQREGYKVWGDKIILQPTPEEDKELELFYYATLPRLQNMEDVPAFHSQFHELLIYYTLAKFNFQDEEEDKQMNAWSDYAARKDDFIRYYRRKEIIPIQDVYGL